MIKVLDIVLTPRWSNLVIILNMCMSTISLPKKTTAMNAQCSIHLEKSEDKATTEKVMMLVMEGRRSDWCEVMMEGW